MIGSLSDDTELIHKRSRELDEEPEKLESR